ncbi:MAG: cellulose binding domain-containing protein, partial [Actinocrinis sp.]
SSPAAGGATCTVAASVTGSWSGGFQMSFTVTNSGTSALTGWTVSYSWAGSQTIASSWNATVAQSGQAVTASSVSYNGSLAPGASTSWGLVGTGAGQALTGLTCAAH